jgi:hypothetical protein
VNKKNRQLRTTADKTLRAASLRFRRPRSALYLLKRLESYDEIIYYWLILHEKLIKKDA